MCIASSKPRVTRPTRGVTFVRLGFAQSASLIFDVDTLPLNTASPGKLGRIYCFGGCASESLSAFGFPKIEISLAGCSLLSPVAGKSIPEGDCHVKLKYHTGRRNASDCRGCLMTVECAIHAGFHPGLSMSRQSGHWKTPLKIRNHQRIPFIPTYDP